jgi:hypothetical protein
MPRDKYATEIERARSRALCVRVSKITWIEFSHKIDDVNFSCFLLPLSVCLKKADRL